MHVQSVTFISEYNQTYHTSHLVIIVYILLCVIGAQLKWISTTQTLSPVKYFSKYFHRNSKLKNKSKDKSTNHPTEQVQSCSTEAKQNTKQTQQITHPNKFNLVQQRQNKLQNITLNLKIL